MNNTVDLLAAVYAHLTEFDLPPTASVHVAAAMSPPQVTVQMPCGAPSVVANGLLAWADTLTEITAGAWRVPQGDSVHLSVTGRLPGGISVKIYGGLPVTHCSQATDLAPNATTTLPLVTLRHLATPGQAREEVIA